MDTTNTYIKMCIKAVEIQKQRRPGHPEDWPYGDCWSDGEKVFIVVPDSFPVQGYIWLPRQDQLQEMVQGEYSLAPGLAKVTDFDWIGYAKSGKLAFFRGYMPDEIIVEADSMERLWLAFVMHEKYQKVWNGTDWVKKV